MAPAEDLPALTVSEAVRLQFGDDLPESLAAWGRG
jgi:hypothetical protein